MSSSNLDNICVNALRFLAADTVQKANSGHPGLPMGAAAAAYALWTRCLKHNPFNPHWADHDRFVLSAGHGSALLYALLHLTGYDLSLEDLQNFRQWNSRTPGHPESHLTPGVETTTGPLGQGIGNAVGMAIAEAHLAARFNKPGHPIVNHFTYALAGDGCLMEGVAAEACSLAGHLQLGKLIVLYDDNRVSLAGSTNLSFSEDVGQRFEAYGWHIQHVSAGNNPDVIEQAIRAAQAVTDQPSLIMVHTQIGFGAPHKQGLFEVHGSPLGSDELKAAKENLGWPVEPMFHIPAEVQAHYRQAVEMGRRAEDEWNLRFTAYTQTYPQLAAEFKRIMAGELPAGWDAALPTFPADAKGLATRKASETVMQALAAKLPELMGGSADLNPSTFTWLKGAGDFQPPALPQTDVQGAVGGPWGYEGRNVHFGVREHAMGAIVNGMARHGGFIPYGSTFFVFADYVRPAVRLSAIMRIGSVWVFTHDSIGVGEDGPTHQPVEHLATLRAVPDLLVLRPCDANETAWAWKLAIENRQRPTALVLTRQNVPTLDRTVFASAEGTVRGAYVLNPAASQPDVILMATGSEVVLIVEAEKQLAAKGIRARLVSMPCWELFEEQAADYRESVLPDAVTARIAVEAGVSLGWHKWIGGKGTLVTLDHYGASAPAPKLMEEFGFTVEQVVEKALAAIEKGSKR
jgi:transketolase